ncbi:TPA: hypothetical protein ACXM9F_006788, partial [Burkholderia cenocepacia]
HVVGKHSCPYQRRSNHTGRARVRRFSLDRQHIRRPLASQLLHYCQIGYRRAEKRLSVFGRIAKPIFFAPSARYFGPIRVFG